MVLSFWCDTSPKPLSCLLFNVCEVTAACTSPVRLSFWTASGAEPKVVAIEKALDDVQVLPKTALA